MSEDKNIFTLSNAEQANLLKRHRKVRNLKLQGIFALGFSVSVLLLLLISVTYQALPAIQQTVIELDITLDEKTSGRKLLAAAVNQVAVETLGRKLKRKERRSVSQMFSIISSYEIDKFRKSNPDKIGQTITMTFIASDQIDQVIKGAIARTKADGGLLSEAQDKLLATLEQKGSIAQRFNWSFFENSDSREPELAGIAGAFWGSVYTMIVTFVLSFPIGIMAATYLEEFARPTLLNRIIEANINNLAAVPSIIYGLLGLFVFLSLANLPRSTPLVGGLVLSLMTFPYIIIATRAALKSVPPSIREAALAMGASRMQTTVHHVIPLAFPGILTGTIIGMSRALGETAPLIMIGMVAFIADVPQSLTDPSTSMPVQVYLWADSAERAYAERSALAILALLAILITMNGFAVYLRQKLERKW